MKVAQAYAAIDNNGALPQIRFLVAAIGSKGNVIGQPAIIGQRRVISPSIASAVLHDLRGPVKGGGTARAANSIHAIVYGKTGTSSRNEDALFVGLTEDFVGCLWLGYDQPKPMPGVHGGGTPAKAFSKLTDFYYVRLAQTHFAESEEMSARASPWGRLRAFASRQPGITALTALSSLLMTCFLLPALFRRRERSVGAQLPEPQHDDRELPLQSS